MGVLGRVHKLIAVGKLLVRFLVGQPTVLARYVTFV
jgi:hypothetical protein